MQTAAAITAVVFFLLVATTAYYSIRLHLAAVKKQLISQEQTEQLAVRMHPAYAQMLREERAYTLEQERARAEIEHRRQAEEHTHEQETERLQLLREKQTVELALLQHDFQLRQYTTLTRVTPETYLLGLPQTTTITALPALKSESREKEKSPAFLMEPAYQRPRQELLLSHLQENSLVVSPGIRASTGEVITVDIVAVPHLKIIGSSGFGKSCLAGSIIDQAVQTNSPRVLQLALLDLEHKTSRLFEDAPHVATLNYGKRRVQMVATTPDEVAEYLGILKLELDRRAKLTDAELARLPVLLIYVEEMLSLQYEVIDPKLLALIFQSLTILSIRGLKYGMLLLACMQTDYSTDELKVSQKMFRFRGAAGIDTSAARAAGFMNTELIKANFQHGKPGQFVVEYPSFSDVILAADFNVKQKIAGKTGFSFDFRENKETENVPVLQEPQTGSNASATTRQPGNNTRETPREAKQTQVQELRANQWGKVAIIEKVWRVKPGSGKSYKQAEAEYEQIITWLEKIEA